MKNKGNKLLIFVLAFVMFATTWTTVFAADGISALDTGDGVQNEEQTGGDQTSDTNNDSENDENNDNGEGTGDSDEPGDEVSGPVAVMNDDQGIDVTWDAVENATYSVEIKRALTADGAYSASVTKTPEEGATTVTFAKGELKGSGYYKATITTTVDEVATTEETAAIEYSLGKATAVSGLKALSGNKMVRIKWTKPASSDTPYAYVIKRYNSKSDYTNDKPAKTKIYLATSSYIKTDGSMLYWDCNSLKTGSDYWFRVYATTQYSKTDESLATYGSKAASISKKGPVRPMYITFKLKKQRTLTSLSNKKKKTFAKNTSLVCTGYGGGCYYFSYGGQKYRVSRTSAKNQVAKYNGKGNWNYTKEEADLFVNQYASANKLSSKTNYFIWTSFYTQRVYIMKKTNGKWKCIKDWDCATGKASTPSPTGKKAIGSFRKTSHHGIKWWSGFSGGNSFHGKKSSWVLSLPQSHGCIRNDVSNAKWIYDNCKINTRVLNY